jgi:monoamine oxidase
MQLAGESNQLDAQRGTSDTTESVDELLSRRDMIRLAGAGAAVAASTTALGKFAGIGWAEFPAERAGRVVIVGAGIAGLNAAFHLKRNGVRAEVFEGQSRIGGRIYTAYDVMGKGLTTEWGAEFIDSDNWEMRKLAKMFDLPLIDVFVKSETRLWDAYYFGGRMRRDKEILAAYKPIAKRIATDNKDLVWNSWKDSNDLAKRLDRKSITEYLHELGVNDWLFDLLNVAYETENGTSCNKQSSMNLIGEIGTNVMGGFQVFGESNQRFKVKGGNHKVPEALAQRLAGQIHMGMELLRIGKNSAGEYQLTFRSKGGGTKVVKADHVIMAIPFSVLRDIEIDLPLPAKKREAIDKLNYGTNAKLALGFNRRYWRDQGTVGLFFTDLPLQSGWDSGQLQKPEYSSLTLFFGGPPGVEQAKTDIKSRAQMYLPQIDMMYPGAMKEFNGKMTQFNWPHFKWTKGSYSTYTVGQATSFGGAEFEPVGQLYFAGEHCFNSNQGFMEGGAETGLKSAQLLLKALK